MKVLGGLIEFCQSFIGHGVGIMHDINNILYTGF